MSTNAEQRLQQQCDDLMLRLSASQAREDELRADLSKVRHALNAGMRETAELTRKLEAAEARIKASQDQLPDCECGNYAEPPIPPELAELQRKLDQWKNSALTPREESMQRENAELTRKLAEQQAVNFEAKELLFDCASKLESQWNRTDGLPESYKELFMKALHFARKPECYKHENAELRRLLESKVPEGWIPTDEELTKIYNDANGITGGKNPPISTQRIFTAMRAMLSAAPQPKEPKQ